MHPKQHLVLGILFSILIFLFFQHIGWLAILIIILSNFLVDVDHYIYFVFKEKKISLRESYWWYIKRAEKFNKLSAKKSKEYQKLPFIFHGFEFWIILFCGSFFFPILSWVLFGVMVHMISDISGLAYKGSSVSPKVSTLFTFIKNKKKKEFIF